MFVNGRNQEGDFGGKRAPVKNSYRCLLRCSRIIREYRPCALQRRHVWHDVSLAECWSERTEARRARHALNKQERGQSSQKRRCARVHSRYIMISLMPFGTNVQYIIKKYLFFCSWWFTIIICSQKNIPAHHGRSKIDFFAINHQEP
jgi:hypothetical protein